MSHDHPGPDEIDAWLAAVADGRASRDAADRWAARLIDDDTVEWDQTSWWALNLLYGIDLRSGPGEPYLHDTEQIRGWLTEFRRRRGEGTDVDRTGKSGNPKETEPGRGAVAKPERG